MSDFVPWLRTLAEQGGRGVVNNIDARCLGRIADELERLRSIAIERMDLFRQAATKVEELEAARPEVQSAVAITDEMIEEAIEAHVEPFDSGDAVGAMRAALTAALGAAQASTYRADAIEECARHLEREADVATNSLHCGDNSGTIAAVHRVSRVYYEAAKSLRAIKNDGIRTEPSSVPSAECK